MPRARRSATTLVARGTRSDHPLFCTLSQLGMSTNMLSCSDHVHGSNGALKFVQQCIERMRRALPRAAIELFFFSDRYAKNHAQVVVIIPGRFFSGAE